MRAGDIPEEAAALEAEDAIMSLIEGVRSTRPAPGMPKSAREKKQAKGAAKLEEKLEGARSLTPVSRQLARPERDEMGRLQKGQSLNPGGISKIDRAIRDYARSHCFEAVDFCVMVMRDNLCRTSDRLAAAAAIIDNARLPKSVDEGGEDGKGASITINVLRIGDQVIKF